MILTGTGSKKVAWRKIVHPVSSGREKMIRVETKLHIIGPDFFSSDYKQDLLLHNTYQSWKIFHAVHLGACFL